MDVHVVNAVRFFLILGDDFAGACFECLQFRFELFVSILGKAKDESAHHVRILARSEQSFFRKPIMLWSNYMFQILKPTIAPCKSF